MTIFNCGPFAFLLKLKALGSLGKLGSLQRSALP